MANKNLEIVKYLKRYIIFHIISAKIITVITLMANSENINKLWLKLIESDKISHKHKTINKLKTSNVCNMGNIYIYYNY
jgi:uncharacterized membrane protein